MDVIHIGLARIEIKEVTHSTGPRRIYLSRPHAYLAIIVTFLASSYHPTLTLNSLHTEIRIEYYQETSRRVIGGKSTMRTLSYWLTATQTAKQKYTIAENALLAAFVVLFIKLKNFGVSRGHDLRRAHSVIATYQMQNR